MIPEALPSSGEELPPTTSPHLLLVEDPGNASLCNEAIVFGLWGPDCLQWEKEALNVRKKTRLIWWYQILLRCLEMDGLGVMII